MNTVAREGFQVKLVKMHFGGCVPAEQIAVHTALNNRLGNMVSNTTDGIDDRMV
jgi:hypothetical protein